ncbi:hypothetical protein FGG08_001976 [Glutinoglossum americanum]|uniref:Uncharacterized protein n=1 Tax=Glutinoglossum americanum TaxID=1670608 RepID=A0A9P8I5Y1_9PEZI|nr:hypothetical protein FGG08_001976 [Glutinoglossum americanum]
MPSPLHHDADASTASPHLHPNDSNSNGNSNGNNGNITDRNHLAPEDAFYTHSSPPRWQRHRHPSPNSRPTSPSPKSPAAPSSPPRRRRRDKPRGRSTSRRRRLRTWKKLLWVKQSYPDNYTDHQTFLSQLQRNPRFQPYDFWPLMADSTVIVQHVCSVVIFACCFVGIHQKRVSPVGVVSWGNAGTVVGWGLWDWWVGKAGEGEAAEVSVGEGAGAAAEEGSETAGSAGSSTVGAREYANGLGLKFSAATAAMASPHRPTHSHSTSGASTHSTASLSSPASLPPNSPPPFFSPRNHQRLATAKSAILIYYALLGLSPILKSLTRSTTPDSIWAMSAWLMCINVFFFDYGGEVK